MSFNLNTKGNSYKLLNENLKISRYSAQCKVPILFLQMAPQFLMPVQKLQKDMSSIFTGTEEPQGPEKRVKSCLRETFNNIILNVITDAPLILTNRRKTPLLPAGDVVFFLPFA